MSAAFDLVGFRQLLLTREVGRTLRHYGEVGSTNDLALEAAAAGAEHGLMVVAESQTAGRGRSGSSWTAPPSHGLTVSLLLRPEMAPSRVAELTFVAAVAVAQTLREGGLAAHIKWPNDVLVGRGKICGILCESRIQGARLDAVVVGIGLNVNQEAAELPPGAASIRLEVGEPVDRAVVLAEVLNRFEPLYVRVVSGRWSEVRAAWEELSTLHRGHRVRVRSGERLYEGTSDGIGEDGALRVRGDDGEVTAMSSGSAEFS